MRNTHSTSNGDIETFELVVLTDDGDETNVIVDMVHWWNRHCNFGLGRL
jgi:hypothetical protein